MKNSTYIEKCIEFDAVTYTLIITKGYFSLYDEKIAFCLKRGVLLSLKISDFDWKRVGFFVQNPQKGGVFQTWVRAWYTLWSEVGGGRGGGRLFTSASDYASEQWRVVLHILVTCSPHVNKCWVTLAIYGIRCGWSHWPIIIQHVRA